jgi:MerR family transcriptional regulator, thiopeptide resistance regulator
MTPADDPGELLTGGGLARATGLTVRTLHHYDRLGLLSPLRDAGGRRRYGPAEARRLHQIIALRGFGLPLAEIARLFEGQGPDPLRLLRRQLAQAEERIAAAQRLRHSLLAVISGLTSHDGEVTASQLVELIERMITVDRRLTREQLDQMIEQRRQLTARLTPPNLRSCRSSEKSRSASSPRRSWPSSSSGGSSCSRPISPGPRPARNEHPRSAPWPARHKVRHEARGSVEHLQVRPMV